MFNSILSPRIQFWTNVPFAIWCGTAFCVMSLGSALILTKFIPADDVKEINLPTNQIQQSRRTSSQEIFPISETSSLLPKEQKKEAGLISQISHLPLLFWLLCMICVFLYSTVVPFNNIASQVLVDKWFHDDIRTAGLVMRL